MEKETAFVKKTEFLVPDGWPRVQAELTSIVEVVVDVGSDQVPAEIARDESIVEEYRRGLGGQFLRGRTATSYRVLDPKSQMTRYYTFEAL